MKRFLVGRQFIVLFLVFLIAQLTSFPNIPSNFIGLSHVAIEALITSGLPGIMFVLTFGQLIPSLFVEEYTLPYNNFRGCYSCVRLSLAAEYIGVCHFSWLLYHIVSNYLCHSIIKATIENNFINGEFKSQRHENAANQQVEGTDKNVAESAGSVVTVVNNPLTVTEDITREDSKVESKNEIVSDLNLNHTNTTSSINVLEDSNDMDTPLIHKKLSKVLWYDLVRYMWSSSVTITCIIFVSIGIGNGYASLKAPILIVFFVFFGMLLLLFYLEGSIIAIATTQYWDRETFKVLFPRAYKLHLLVSQPKGFKRYMIGRQFLTVAASFLLAQVTTFPYWINNGYDKIAFFIFIRTGFMGVLIVLSFGQLLPKLLAAEFPLRFMDLYGMYSIVWLSLFLESFGIGHCAWLIFYLTKDSLCHGNTAEDLKPQVLHVHSQEILFHPSNPSLTSVANAVSGADIDVRVAEGNTPEDNA